MNFSISKITKNEVDFIKQLELDLGLGFWSKKDYLNELNRPDSIALIIKVDQIKCGFIIGRLITADDKNEAEIYNIAIAKNRQNKNLGTLLLNGFIDEGKKYKLEKIFLEVRKSNETAISFYKKNKFREIGKRIGFYTNPNEDAFLFCRTIEK